MVALLARFSVRLVVSSASLLDRVSQEAGSLGMMDYEGEYLTQGQRWRTRTPLYPTYCHLTARASEGRQGLVSANLGGLRTVAAVAWPLLHHPQLGSQHKLSTAALDTRCNYCFWALNFQTGPGRGEDSRGVLLCRDIEIIDVKSE